MAWNNEPQGISPAQASAGFHVSGDSPNPNLYPHAPNPNETIANAVSAVTKIIAQKKADEQANAILSTLTKTPQTGGSDALEQYLAVQKAQHEQTNNSLMENLLNAKTNYYNRPPRATAVNDPNAGKVFVPDLGNGQSGYLTPNEYANKFGVGRKPPPPTLEQKTADGVYQEGMKKLSTDAAGYGFTPDSLSKLDTTTPGAVKFVAGADIPGFTHTDPVPADAGHSLFGSPSAGTVAQGDNLSTKDADSILSTDDAKSVLAQGTKPDGTPFSMPYNTYKALLDREKTLPKPSSAVAPSDGGSGQSSSGPVATPEVQQIQSDFSSGKLSRDDAKAKLLALGFQ